MDGLELDGFTLLRQGLERLESSMRAQADDGRCSTAPSPATAERTLIPVDSLVDSPVGTMVDGAPIDRLANDDESVDRRVHFARCADGNGTLSHLFFSNDAFDLARAKAICSRCGLAEQCRATAIERAEPYGVWGGALIIDGVEVANKRGRGRPPKNPRPPVVVDEVPLPPRPIASPIAS